MPDHDPRTALARLVEDLASRPRPLPLTGHVQPYAWGGFTFLRELTGLDLPDATPAAEWWIGAHPLAPSTVATPVGAVRLDELILHAPRALLGDRVVERFGPRLPFLLKVLDVRDMLSIQAHPSKAQAEAGFARENSSGVAPDAPHRTYKDDNHKPEAQVALTAFWMLSGFRPAQDVAAVLRARPELAPLASWLQPEDGAVNAMHGDAAAIRALYEHVMTLEQDEVDALIDPLIERLTPAFSAGALDRGSPDFWAVRAASVFRLPGDHRDRGILVIYLLNLVHLAPGDASFFDAGLLHAYLEGAAVEIMASSDNVIRGGLTAKHVDVPELLRVASFEPSVPRRLGATGADVRERRYDAPAAEFGLARLVLDARPFDVGLASGPEAAIVLEGGATLRWDSGTMDLARGGAALVPAGLRYTLQASTTAAIAFRAFVPLGQSSEFKKRESKNREFRIRNPAREARAKSGSQEPRPTCDARLTNHASGRCRAETRRLD